MNQRLYLLPLLLIICLSIPSGAAAQYTIAGISGGGQTGRIGQALEPFVVEVRQNGSLVSGVIVTFLPDNDNIPFRLSNALSQTNENGVAQTTLTLLGAGTVTITASVGDASTTFTATAIAASAPPPPTIPTGPLPPPPPIETKVVRISGDDQRGLPGKPLANPFVVQVLDEDGDPFKGATVKFSVLRGGGSLSATTPTTDADGQAESLLTLGAALGTNKVQVNVAGISQVLVFSAEATTAQSVPTTLSIISGDNQGGVTGETLTDPFIVEVRYGNDLPLAGLTVTFTVLTGGGTLSATTATTDANGQAEGTLTVGSDPGANTVEVSTANSVETVTFNAEAVLPPPTPTTLSTVPDLTGATAMDSFAVEVHDQNGDPLGGVTVTFAILGDDGSQRTTAVPTDENGGAAFMLPAGSDPGRYTITGSVEGIAETVTFTIVVPFEFDLSLPAGLSLIHIPLRVRTVNEMPGTIGSVADLYDALGGTDTVNWLIAHDSQTQTWRGYFGESDRGTIADSVLTDQTGILASVKIPISIHLGGDPLGTDGASTITLTPGLNLVGIPLRDPRVARASDLLALEGIGEDITAIVVTDNGEFKVVGRAGDEGDIPVTGGHSFILIVQQRVTIPITGKAWGE